MYIPEHEMKEIEKKLYFMIDVAQKTHETKDLPWGVRICLRQDDDGHEQSIEFILVLHEEKLVYETPLPVEICGVPEQVLRFPAPVMA